MVVQLCVLRVQASNSGGLFRDMVLLKPMDKVQTFEFDGAAAKRGLIDPFGRAISYLRVSVTDRCDFRCVYCMVHGGKHVISAEGRDFDAGGT